MNGQIDMQEVSRKVGTNVMSTYLMCCVLQKHFGHLLQAPGIFGSHMVNGGLELTVKTVLRISNKCCLSLDNWCKAVGILPLDLKLSHQVFACMLSACKITKFWEVNYKILSQILATPKIISAVKKQENIQWCAWCGSLANIEHILLHCSHTILIHNYVLHHSPL